jgi:hypothetical protein
MSENGFTDSVEAIRQELSNKRKIAKDLEQKIGRESGSLETNYIIHCTKLIEEIFLYLETIFIGFAMFQKRDEMLQEMFKLLSNGRTDPSVRREIDDILKKYKRLFSDL